MAILTTASYDAVRRMRPSEQELLIVKLSDPLLVQFFKKQQQIVREQLDGLDLDNERDMKAYRELRLLGKLWHDLETFAQDWNGGETSQDGEK